MCLKFNSDVHKMEKEQEAEKERDRMRSTKIFDPKFSINEPPPKVWAAVKLTYCFFKTFFRRN